MTITANIEQCVWQTLMKQLVDGLPNDTVQIPGTRDAVVDTTTDRWVRFTPLSLPREHARSGQFIGSGLFQVSCFARFADQILTNTTEEAWTLAGLVARIYEAGDFPITDHASNTVIGSLTVNNAPEMQYVPEADVASSVVGGSGTAPSNVHMVAVTFGFIVAQ